jgi:cleavage and polyadenylation specificity factor subunit 3
MDLTIFGPGRNHLATCLHLNIDGAGFLLDAGLDPLRDGRDALPDLEQMEARPQQYPVDWILISHAHMDHMGALPELARRHPQAGILCTETTWKLTRQQLCRHAALWDERFAAGELGDFPLFTVADVQDLDERVRFIAWGESLKLEAGWSPTPVSIQAFDAGHIPGSIGFLIGEEGDNLFYTGDTCARPQSIIHRAQYPTTCTSLVCESTIAFSNLHLERTRKDEIDRLAAAISEVSSLGGSILIPVFNMGRAQEMLYILHQLKRKDRIPPMPVHLGRSAWEISRIYDMQAKKERRLHPDFQFSASLIDILDYEGLSELPEDSRIYLVPSGMLAQDSLSQHLAKRLLPHPLHAIFFVGHCSGGSLGKSVMEAEPGDSVLIDEKEISCHCRIESFLFSSHSNRDELLKAIDRIQPQELVLLHGRKDSADLLKEKIASTNPELPVRLPRPGAFLELGMP